MATMSFVESLSPRRRITNITAMATLSLFIIITIVVKFRLFCSDEYYASSMESSKDKFNSTTSFSASHRKLLQQGEVQTNRIWGDKSCSSDIVITQGPTSPMPSGIPEYTVEIFNACITPGCSVSAIHFHCGWFSSARLINPRYFKRLKYDDCLVNDGKPLFPGETIAFGYANTFPYQLSVASAKC